MATIEGITIKAEITALAQGEGFIHSVETTWDVDKNDPDQMGALKGARDERLIGRLAYSHKDTYSAAETANTATIDQFETDIVAFIQTYNAE